jgi:4-hydroxy-3-methylbut-2-enyl diphosphate reductase
MQIFVAKRAGFCFGVRRAINIAFDVAEENKNGVYTLGPIIHNPQVIEKLRKAGVEPVENLGRLRGKKVNAVIIRTHGIPLQTSKKLSKKFFKAIDATCPFVKKAQHYAKLLNEESYQVVILGDSRHPEVDGLLSYAGKDSIVINDKDKLPKLRSRVGIVVQTTQPVDALKRLFSKMIEQTKEIKVYNTICNSTALRMRETEEIAQKADIMIVVGGKNSANTTQLANLCRSLSVPAYHIETASELRNEWFKGAGSVGITAGASTPDWIIKDVKKALKGMGGSRSYGI